MEKQDETKVQNYRFEFLKHLATLNSAIIVLGIGLLDKSHIDTAVDKGLLAASGALFFLSLGFCVWGMMRFPEHPARTDTVVYGAGVGFLIGLLIFAFSLVTFKITLAI